MRENFAKLFCAGLKSGESDFGRVNAGALEIFGVKVNSWGNGSYNNCIRSFRYEDS